MVTRRELLVGTLAAAPLLAVARRGALAQPEGRPKRLLFVHGRSQQARDAALLRSEWIAGLREGARKLGRTLPSDVEIVLPYYLDVLDRFVAQAKIPLGSQTQTRRTAEQQEFFAFQASIAEQLRSKAHITDGQVNAEYGTNRMPKGPLNWWWVQAMLRALDQHGPGMTKNTIETFTRDVFLYATRAELRDKIDRIVTQSLTQEPTVIVGHSLGSVVAYTVLRNARGALQVPLYVTVGSPLGIPAVRDYLLPLRFPSPDVGAWYNAFDIRDCLASYPLDEDNFPGVPGVDNYGGVSNPTNDRHGIVGYLDDTRVAGKILDALGV